MLFSCDGVSFDILLSDATLGFSQRVTWDLVKRS